MGSIEGEVFERRTVGTTGGIFEVEYFGILKKVAEGLEAVGEHIGLIGANTDDMGGFLSPDKVRVIINSPGGLENFWKVADQARKYGNSLAEKGSLSNPRKAAKLDKFIAQAIQNLPHSTGRE